MHKLSSCFLLIALLLPGSAALADYAWIPGYKSLFLRAGGEFLTSSENFSADGFRTDILYQRGAFANIPLSYSQFLFFVEPEYGFSKNLSVSLRGEFAIADVNPLSGTGPSFGASGLGAVRAALKWKLRPKEPILTAEIGFGIPTASYDQTKLAIDELLLNDGSFDLGLILHAGYRIDEFFLAFSPGMLFRSGGYSSAITLNGAAGGRYGQVYGFVFVHSIFSLEARELFDSNILVHDALGSGGTFARLSGGPRGIDGGIKLGVNVYKKYAIELGVTQALWGKQYPNYFKVGLNLLFVNSFYQEEKRTRVREVPFEEEHRRPNPAASEPESDETEDVRKEEIPNPENEPDA